MLKFSPTKRHFSKNFFCSESEESFEILWNIPFTTLNGILEIYLFILGQKCAEAASLIHY
jgi:hypothetical protein